MSGFDATQDAVDDTATVVNDFEPGDDCLTLVMPIPENHPLMPAHPRFGEPSKHRVYYGRNGEILFAICRFDQPDGGKQVLPQTLWRDASGKLAWRWKGIPGQRPLHNLDQLVDRPDAPVIVVEGEKCADAASEIFSDHVVTTSSGGAQAASKTDWSALAGRDVIIWPDADAPGQKYAGDVAEILVGLGCTVRMIDEMALASQLLDGGVREPAEGWDIADAADEWKDPSALREAALKLAKPFERSLREERRREDVTSKVDGGGEDPLPLFPPLGKAMPYPLDAMGGLQAAAEAIARKVQVPAATAVQSVLAIASHAAQAHCDVVLPYGQRRPLSLFFVTVAGSGDRKSSADNEASRPIAKREKALREEYREAMKAHKIASVAWQAEKRRVEADKRLDVHEKSAALLRLGPEPLPPLHPFLAVSDMTLDGLMKNWLNALASLAIFTSEGATFTGGHGMSKESRLRTAASLSEIWDGKPLKRVRSLDGVMVLPGRRIALHVMIQPDASHAFLADPELRDQGLLSRVLVAAPESIAGERHYRDPAPEDEADIRAFGARILAVLETPAPLADGRNELAPRALPMTEEATALWVDFFNYVEAQSGPKGDLARLRDFASKAAEHAARIAGVLAVIRDLQAERIEPFEMECAVALMNWYLCEAERLRAASRLDPRLLRASALLEWMQAHDGEIPFRDILRLGPAPLRTKAAAEEAVAVLKDHRWLEVVSTRPLSFTTNWGDAHGISSLHIRKIGKGACDSCDTSTSQASNCRKRRKCCKGYSRK